MKYILLLLLSGPAMADIEAVKVGTTTKDWVEQARTWGREQRAELGL